MQFCRHDPIAPTSFVQDIASDSENKAIVIAMIALAESMKMKIVTEGVETIEQLRSLLKLGCHRIQGFLLDRPMTGSDMARLLSDGKNYLNRSGGTNLRQAADLCAPAHPVS